MVNDWLNPSVPHAAAARDGQWSETCRPTARSCPARSGLSRAPSFGGLVGEGEEQNAVGRYALFQQVRHTISERARLARTRAGNYQSRARQRRHRRALRVQLRFIIDLELNRFKVRLEDILRATPQAAAAPSRMKAKPLIIIVALPIGGVAFSQGGRCATKRLQTKTTLHAAGTFCGY